MLTSGFDPVTLVVWGIVLIIALPLHELAHALMADYLGDPTPRSMGRITLNPFKHLDLFGSITFLLVGFGWAKPVMVNPYNLRGNPHTSMAIVALVGPLTNFALAGLGAIPFHLDFLAPIYNANPEIMGFFFFFLTQFVWLNLLLGFFNLLPVPPLDGYKILVGILPTDLAIRMQVLNQYGFLILIVLIFFLPRVGVDVLDVVVRQPTQNVFNMLTGL